MDRGVTREHPAAQVSGYTRRVAERGSVHAVGDGPYRIGGRAGERCGGGGSGGSVGSVGSGGSGGVLTPWGVRAESRTKSN